jgi:hypothetical protein
MQPAASPGELISNPYQQQIQPPPPLPQQQFYYIQPQHPVAAEYGPPIVMTVGVPAELNGGSPVPAPIYYPNQMMGPPPPSASTPPMYQQQPYTGSPLAYHHHQQQMRQSKAIPIVNPQHVINHHQQVNCRHIFPKYVLFYIRIVAI